MTAKNRNVLSFAEAIMKSCLILSFLTFDINHFVRSLQRKQNVAVSHIGLYVKIYGIRRRCALYAVAKCLFVRLFVTFPHGVKHLNI